MPIKTASLYLDGKLIHKDVSIDYDSYKDYRGLEYCNGFFSAAGFAPPDFKSEDLDVVFSDKTTAKCRFYKYIHEFDGLYLFQLYDFD